MSAIVQNASQRFNLEFGLTIDMCLEMTTLLHLIGLVSP